MTPHVYILILNWNGKTLLKHCLDSVLAIDYSNYTTLVIDNNSIDGSDKMMEKNYSQVEYLQLKKNYGFSRGYNNCFKYLKDKKPEYVLLLNNDTEVESNILSSFIDAAQKYGKDNIFGGKIFYKEYSNKIWYAGGIANIKSGLLYHIGLRKLDSMKYSILKQTDYVTGCCLFTSWQVINQLKGFDENFDMYGEDVDFCFRCSQNGGKIFFIPSSILWHHVSSSLGGEYSYKKWKRKYLGKIKLIKKYNKNIFSLIPIFNTMVISFIELLILVFKLISKRL